MISPKDTTFTVPFFVFNGFKIVRPGSYCYNNKLSAGIGFGQKESKTAGKQASRKTRQQENKKEATTP
ncbi:MAG: hypothetical protein AB8G77_10865 [Rhodothermales bacterium]